MTVQSELDSRSAEPAAGGTAEVRHGGPVLMLDFDGVLHPAQGSEIPEFHRLPLLERALKGSTCRIVISSTWREHYSLGVLVARLGPEVGSRVVDVLGPDGRGPHVRYGNIVRWLAGHTDVKSWRAFDDSAAEFPPALPELILCDGRVGVDLQQIQVLERWLRAGCPASPAN